MYLCIQLLLFENLSDLVEHAVQVCTQLSHSVLNTVVGLEGAVEDIAVGSSGAVHIASLDDINRARNKSGCDTSNGCARQMAFEPDDKN